MTVGTRDGVRYLSLFAADIDREILLFDRRKRSVSIRFRKRIEEIYGWTKASAGLRKTRHRGLDCVGWMFTLTVAAYNLIRLPKLLLQTA